MTAKLIFDKTVKGQEEIATRKHGLPSRLRSLLVLVDGKTTVEALVKKVAGLGLNEESIAELLELEFIAPHADSPSAPSMSPAASAAAVSAPVAAPAAAPAPKPAAPPAAAPAAAPGATILPEGETQFQALYNFYTTTIKSTLGLRGFGLQLKVEKCGNIDDFRALRQTYVDAVLKSKGAEMARSLSERLDHLLNLS
ncbi:MAG TPA: hypothetical protein VIF60_06995 [Burkholderiaceae bacterium]|jgi:hypothetical protein